MSLLTPRGKFSCQIYVVKQPSMLNYSHNAMVALHHQRLCTVAYLCFSFHVLHILNTHSHSYSPNATAISDILSPHINSHFHVSTNEICLCGLNGGPKDSPTSWPWSETTLHRRRAQYYLAEDRLLRRILSRGAYPSLYCQDNVLASEADGEVTETHENNTEEMRKDWNHPGRGWREHCHKPRNAKGCWQTPLARWGRNGFSPVTWRGRAPLRTCWFQA